MGTGISGRGKKFQIQRKTQICGTIEYLLVISGISIINKRFPSHVNFGYCDGESQNARNELQNDSAYVFENAK